MNTNTQSEIEQTIEVELCFASSQMVLTNQALIECDFYKYINQSPLETYTCGFYKLIYLELQIASNDKCQGFLLYSNGKNNTIVLIIKARQMPCLSLCSK